MNSILYIIQKIIIRNNYFYFYHDTFLSGTITSNNYYIIFNIILLDYFTIFYQSVFFAALYILCMLYIHVVAILSLVFVRQKNRHQAVFLFWQCCLFLF